MCRYECRHCCTAVELCWCETAKVSVDEVRHGEMAHLPQGWADTAIDWTTVEATECWEGSVQGGVVEWWSYSCKHSDPSLSPLPLDLFLTRPHIFFSGRWGWISIWSSRFLPTFGQISSKFSKAFTFFIICVSGGGVCAYGCRCPQGPDASDTLELELQMAMSHGHGC